MYNKHKGSDLYLDSETTREYIAQKRRLLREQFAINAKQDKIRDMKATVSSEKKKISEAEKTIERTAFKFEEYLKKLERNAVEAMKIADRETKARLEKEAEIQKMCADIAALKSDIVKEEETLKEYKRWAKFLYLLSPSDWREAQEQKRMDRKATKKKEERKLTGFLPPLPKKQDEKQRMSHKLEDMRQSRPDNHPGQSISESTSTRSCTKVSVDESVTEGSSSEEEPELYFTDPQQLLQIIKDLEEETIHLLQKVEEEEADLKEIEQRDNIVKKKLTQELKSAMKKKELLVDAIAREKEKTEELELKIKMFSFEDCNIEVQKKKILKLSKMIANLYTFCVGNVQAAMDPLQMLASIENSILEMEEKLETFPKECLKDIRRKKDKEIMERIREEKLKQIELKRAVRLNRAFEKATAEPQKTCGRKLMKRSQPPSTGKSIGPYKDDTKEKEMAYFFT